MGGVGGGSKYAETESTNYIGLGKAENILACLMVKFSFIHKVFEFLTKTFFTVMYNLPLQVIIISNVYWPHGFALIWHCSDYITNQTDVIIANTCWTALLVQVSDTAVPDTITPEDKSPVVTFLVTNVQTLTGPYSLG